MMLLEINKEDASPNLPASIMFSQTLEIRQNILYKFTEPSIGPPCLCTVLRCTLAWLPENNVNTWN